MKRLAVLLALLAFPAQAELYRPATPAQILPYVDSSTTITAALYHRAVRLVCTTSCFVNFGNPSNTTVPAVTTATGIYLPANEPAIFRTAPGNKVYVIQGANGGNLHVLELSE